MTAILEQVPERFPEQYVAHEAIDNVLSLFAWLDDEGKVLGGYFADRNPATALDPTTWCKLHDDAGKPAGPHVEYAEAQALLLAARMLRLILDDPETVRERAMDYESQAAETLARLQRGGASCS